MKGVLEEKGKVREYERGRRGTRGSKKATQNIKSQEEPSSWPD